MNDPDKKQSLLNREELFDELHRKEAELAHLQERYEMSIRLGRCYSALAKINETIAQFHDREMLFEATVKTLIEYGPFSLALLGTPDELLENFTVDAFYAESESIEEDVERLLKNIESRHFPMREILDGKEMFLCNNPEETPSEGRFADFLARNSLKSGVVLSVRVGERILAGLSVYSSEVGFFVPEMISVLRSIADNLAFAIWKFGQDRQKEAARDEMQAYRNHLEELVDERTDELEENNRKLKAEIEYRERIQAEMRNEEVRLATLLLLNQMSGASEKDIIDFSLEAAARITSSRIGFVITPGEEPNTVSFRIWDEGKYSQRYFPVPEGRIFPESFSEEFLGECIRQERAIPWNNLSAYPNGDACFPHEFPVLDSMLSIPLFFYDQPGQVMGVGNKATPYTDADVNQLTLLIHGMNGLLERKRSLEALQRVSIEAESANRSKSEFLANMSHEIRTPLNGVIGLADLLSETKLDRKQTEYVRLIKSSGKSLLSLVNDVLDFSNIETGKLELENIDFNIKDAIESAIGSLSQKATEKNLEIYFSVSPGTPCEVRGDAGRIRQIIHQLLDNAIKFTEKGGVRIRLEPGEHDEKTVQVLCSVKDTGIGIPEDRMDRLFKSFTQGDASSAKRFGGIGMGLALSRQLISLMGGELAVESRPGEGSLFTFSIRLNRSLSHASEDIIRKHLLQIENAADSLRTARTLVVDENELQRNAIREQLKIWGMPVDAVSSGSEALVKAEDAMKNNATFSLAIIDSTVAKNGEPGSPLMNGMELARKIRNVSDGISVIMLSNLNNETEAVRVREAGVAIHLGKPVYGSSLYDAIALALFHERPEISAIEPNPSEEKSSGQAERIVRILVAEDNKVNQIVVREILKKAGYSCEIVPNGTLAVKTIRENGPEFDLVLMDCQMPEMDGYEATRQIRELERLDPAHRHIPIIALTANTTKGDKEKCIDSGMDAYCSKPVDARRLLVTIHSHLPKYPET